MKDKNKTTTSLDSHSRCPTCEDIVLKKAKEKIEGMKIGMIPSLEGNDRQYVGDYNSIIDDILAVISEVDITQGDREIDVLGQLESDYLKVKYYDLRPYLKSVDVQEKVDEVFNWFHSELRARVRENEDAAGSELEHTPMYKCQSYYDDDDVLHDCTCGRCGQEDEPLQGERK